MSESSQPSTSNADSSLDQVDDVQQFDEFDEFGGIGEVGEDQVLLEDVPAIKGALKRYRIMAYVVGVLLVVLTLVGMPLKYIWGDGRVVTWTGVPHGWLYMILIITAIDLGRRVKWSWKRLLGIALAGTMPFLSFVAEHSATKNVRATIADVEQRGI
ncbi:DUF3817 domain-containing protein [Propionibacteriaceae bacterium G1746]|uniref:DUF3817 domain-containing protein n=1 Tax=Aestuariimicrobium sp. G57 TaxID=3418485 RepID=UPI003C224C69